MSFTQGGVANMINQLKAAGGDLFPDTPVDLYQGPAGVMIPLHVGSRRSSEVDLTAGAAAETMLATIDADAWDMVAGRPPQKGDVIYWAGQRYAVISAHIAAPAGQKAFYKAPLQG